MQDTLKHPTDFRRLRNNPEPFGEWLTGGAANAAHRGRTTGGGD